MSTEHRIYVSKLAKERSANLFVWEAAPRWFPTTLEACMNLDIIGSLQVPILLRWLRLIGATHTAILKPIELECSDPQDPFEFKIVKEGEPLDDMSKAVCPGEYGCFYETGSEDTQAGSIRQACGSMQQVIEILKRDGYIKSLPKTPQREAEQEHGTECIFSRTSDVELCWVFPPCLADGISNNQWLSDGHGTVDLERNSDSFKVAGNVVPMRSDLYQLWKNNEFSVDIYDNFKVRTFTKRASDSFQDLPEYISKPEGNGTDIFLREHFRWTLKTRFAGGDISEDKANDVGENDEMGENAEGQEIQR
ncbi:hypothetical protein C8Q80DRAFT_1175250 [Daedaleopsis nitida]|nr:hypothetical protein C8Q80DRAFT_1175250 [Daedaleopsis nitida]